MWMDGELLQLLYKNEIKSRFWREFPAYKDIGNDNFFLLLMICNFGEF